MAREKLSFSQNKHKTDIVAYLTIVGWLIAWLRGDRLESRFHLNQALSILAADIGINAVFWSITVSGAAGAALIIRGVCGILDFCIWVLWILALVRAVRGSEKPVPVLGYVQLLKDRGE